MAQHDCTATEQVIDKIGLRAFLEGVERICREKSEHISTNWQDEALARLWSRAADRIECAAISKSVDDVSVQS